MNIAGGPGSIIISEIQIDSNWNGMKIIKLTYLLNGPSGLALPDRFLSKPYRSHLNNLRIIYWTEMRKDQI